MTASKTKTKSKPTPFELFTRNEHGLLNNPPIPYVFNEDGSVNWRKMIRPEYLVSMNPNEPDISKLGDKELLILLGGIKELAQVRGYYSVKYSIAKASPEYVCAICTISWIGNYETGGETVSFEAIADTHFDNTSGVSQIYLSAIAENRAFVRAVRNFLKIDIVGKDEIKDANKIQSSASSSNYNPKQAPTHFRLLAEVMEKKNIVFNDVKKRLIKDNYPNAESIDRIEDIDSNTVFGLIERIKEAKGR